MMIRPLAAALAAGSIAALGLGASAFAAMLDMSPPVPWPDTGAKPVVQRDARSRPTMIATMERVLRDGYESVYAFSAR